MLDQFLLDYRVSRVPKDDDVTMTSDLVKLLQRQDYFAFLKYMSQRGGLQDIFDDVQSVRKIPEAVNYHKILYSRKEIDED